MAAVSRKVRLTWCPPANVWILNIYNADGTPLLLGTPLVTGLDLIEQFAYLNIGGQILAQTNGNPDAPPTFENLGDSGHLFFVTP